MIALNGISVGYGGKAALSGLSLSVAPGDFIALAGPNGSGKSTLLKIMAGQMRPLAGTVELLGKPLESYTPRHRSLQVGYFPQSRPTPDMDVATMVAHGRFSRLGFGRVMGRADTAAAAKAIAQAGLRGFEGRPLASLSGGERQRAYLAMLMAQQAELLLLDEPGSFLDIGRQLEVMDILLGLSMQGSTIIFAAHDLPLAFSYATRVAVLDGGKLICDGPPEAVAADKAVAGIFGVALRRQEGGLLKYTLARPEQ